jgi:hypothetical protein
MKLLSLGRLELAPRSRESIARLGRTFMQIVQTVRTQAVCR